jgi:hypothetical protein
LELQKAKKGNELRISQERIGSFKKSIDLRSELQLQEANRVLVQELVWNDFIYNIHKKKEPRSELVWLQAESTPI